ncbi:MAG: nucleotidyltransferase family protein [Scytonematopsis contorta HA4267-MV1]|jgi:hypothetical protein|nr:nucleotidyltransferase family protein [Scytonematopsis contorta HA4267-MV1]
MHTLLESGTEKQEINFCLEIELLLCCVRTQLQPSITQRIKTIAQQDIDWEYLIKIANRHGVTPLLYWSLKITCSESVPQTQLDVLQNSFQANSYNNLLLTQELVKLLDFFEKEKISLLPFKGPILAATVYGNLGLRTISDLDILVHRQDFQKVLDLLIQRGYEQIINVQWESHLIRESGKYNIDLHSDIIPKHLSCSISENYWWENTQPFSFAGAKVPNLSPEAWFFLICLNGNKESWKHLNRICDIAELIRAYPQMDWEGIFEKANKLRCKRLISLALLLAVKLLQAPLPENVLKKLQSDSKMQSLIKKVIEQLFSEKQERQIEVHRTLFHIKTRENLIDKFQVFMSLMNYSGWLQPTEKDLNFVRLPKSLYFLYYLIRPIRIFHKYQQSLLNYLGIN